MSRRQYHPGDDDYVRLALSRLRVALVFLSVAGARKTAARVRLAISSGNGAVRNIEAMRAKAERRAA